MDNFNIKDYLLNNKLTQLNEAFEGFGGVKGLAPVSDSNPLARRDDDMESGEGVNSWIADIDRYPAYKGWKASWEHPGLIVWSHENLPFNIVATPGWDGPGTPIEIQYIDDDNVVSGDIKVIDVIDQDQFESFQEYLKAVAPYLDSQMQATNPMMEMDAEEMVEDSMEEIGVAGSFNVGDAGMTDRAYDLVNRRHYNAWHNAMDGMTQSLVDAGYDKMEIEFFLKDLFNQWMGRLKSNLMTKFK